MSLFQFKIDDEIKLLVFAKDDAGELKKKNYLYITKDDKIVIKGLRFIKNTASPLSKKIFEILKPQILETNNIKFSAEYINELVKTLVNEDLSLLAVNYNVKSVDSYKNKSSIQCQISQAYGEGSHKLIPNWKVGKAGKNKKYCPIKDADNLQISDLFLDNIFLELAIFTENWEHPSLIKKKTRENKKKEDLSKYL